MSGYNHKAPGFAGGYLRNCPAAAHLERAEVIIEPAILPEYLGLEKIRIGEDTSERLNVAPACFGVIVTRRPKYAFRGPTAGMLLATSPIHIIAGGLPIESLLELIAVSRYADGQPLYRQAAIYALDGVELDRSLTVPWMGR